MYINLKHINLKPITSLEGCFTKPNPCPNPIHKPKPKRSNNIENVLWNISSNKIVNKN